MISERITTKITVSRMAGFESPDRGGYADETPVQRVESAWRRAYRREFFSCLAAPAPPARPTFRRFPAGQPIAKRGDRNARFIAVGGAAISQCSPRSAVPRPDVRRAHLTNSKAAEPGRPTALRRTAWEGSSNLVSLSCVEKGRRPGPTGKA
jgi:hypothetical protein